MKRKYRVEVSSSPLRTVFYAYGKERILFRWVTVEDTFVTGGSRAVVVQGCIGRLIAVDGIRAANPEVLDV